MVWCTYEQREFPEDEFYESAEHGLVHRKRPLHNTRGEPIAESGFEATDATAVDELIEPDR